MIIEIPSSKQIPRNSHNDYRNKPKTLIQQSNKNQSSNSKSQTIPLKNGETPPKRYTPCPFLQRRGWCAKGNRCNFMHPNLPIIITTLLHLTLSHKEMDFPQLGTFIYLAMAYIMKHTIKHLIPPLFYPIAEDR